MEMDDERLATHYFACTASSYPGWRWAITVARVPRGKTATVCETNPVPGDGALLSPEWLPYAERLAPGDLSAGDALPYKEDDPLLEAPNLIVVPHVGSATVRTRERMAEMAVENLLAALAGHPMPYPATA